MQMRDSQKHKVLADLAETLDFMETFKRNPEISSDAMQCLLFEVSDIFTHSVKKKLAGSVHKTTKKYYNALILNVDGASRGNPGKSSAGVIIKDESGNVIERISKYIGVATNNIAEYSALIIALEMAKEIGAEKVKIYSDSELMVKQIKGEYRVKNENLKPLHQNAIDLLKHFKTYGIIYIERENNREADKLANQALDKHN